MRNDHWQALMRDAIDRLGKEQPKKALLLMKQAHRQAPADRTVRLWLAKAYRITGDTNQALQLFQGLLAEQPHDFESASAKAFLLRDMGRPADAAEVLLKASEDPSTSLDTLLKICGFLRDCNQYDAAISVCSRAVLLQPQQADLHYKLARLYQATGAFEQALKTLRTALELQPSLGPAWTSIAQQQRFRSEHDPDFVRIKNASEQSYGAEADMCVAFAFGKALDDLQLSHLAWKQYLKGNQLMAQVVPWDRAAWHRFVERSVAASDGNAAGSAKSRRNAVFIVGMPRSGTTLLEQQLDRHPQISGRGELNFLGHFAQQIAVSGEISGQQRKQMAETLWGQLRQQGAETDFYIDKNPLNFRYLDVLFRLMPNARVLHITRDGRDSCLSCFFQIFQHPDTAFCNDLDALTHFYAGYRRLMHHWQTIYPTRIHVVSYEALISANEETLAEVLRFLNVDWHESLMCIDNHNRVVRTASIWQARQPIHCRSINRWCHYADRAPEFFAQLATIDAEFDVDLRAIDT